MSTLTYILRGKKIMKIFNEFSCIVLAKTIDNGVKDPSAKYHHLSVFFPETGESGQLNCSPEAYENITPDLSKPVKLVAEYNDKYQSYRVIKVK